MGGNLPTTARRHALANVLEMERTDPLSVKRAPHLDQGEHCLLRVVWANSAGAASNADQGGTRTGQVSVRETISAAVIDKRARIEEEEGKKAAEQMMMTPEAQQRKAVWQARAKTQAARHVLAKRAEEEAKAAVVQEHQKRALEAQQRKESHC